MIVLRVAVPVPVDREFDYCVDRLDADPVGRCVRVRFGGRRMVGVVVATPDESALDEAALQPIDGYVDDLPAVPPDVLALGRFAADYYQHPIGMALAHAVPPRVRQAGKARAAPPYGYALTEAGIAGAAAASARAATQRALAARMTAAGTLTHAQVLDSPAGQRALVRRWLATGWLTTVGRAASPADAGAADLPPLTADQSRAVRTLIAGAGTFQPSLLHGVTASGKTEVYLACAAAAIARGEQVLFLVPEINLTPQLAARVALALPRARIVQLHSSLGESQRLLAWHAAANGDAQLVLGTRLAVFAPLPRLGLVIVDEEHDGSYKQQDGLRYIARDLAVYRARQRGIPVILGSATPSLETLHQARQGRYRRINLASRALAADPPTVRLVPQRDPSTPGSLSAALRAGLGARLARGEQSLLFINRRGYAPSLLCTACAWTAQCARCSARLVVHLAERRLRCHHCGHEEPVRAACPHCGNQDLLPLGFGTQRLEAELREHFPAARIARIDADSMRRRGAFAALLRATLAGELDILLGTQMLAKGHDFPRLTLVGVLGADNALYSADFRATERLFALLTQVAGRAGRADLPGEVLIQTDFPQHPVYRALLAHDYDAHAEVLLAERRALELPPYARLAVLRAEARQRAGLDAFLAAAHASALELPERRAGVRVYPPVPSRMARRAGYERSQILVQAAASRPLQEFLRGWRHWLAGNAPRTVRWGLDVDPQDVD